MEKQKVGDNWAPPHYIHQKARDRCLCAGTSHLPYVWRYSFLGPASSVSGWESPGGSKSLCFYKVRCPWSICENCWARPYRWWMRRVCWNPPSGMGCASCLCYTERTPGSPTLALILPAGITLNTPNPHINASANRCSLRKRTDRVHLANDAVALHAGECLVDLFCVQLPMSLELCVFNWGYT